MVTLLKFSSQLLILIVGILSVRQAHFSNEPVPSKKSRSRFGAISLSMFGIGFLLFVVTDSNERKENYDKHAAQLETINRLTLLNQKLTQVSLDRDLREIEISFKPSSDQLQRIAEAYRKTVPPETGLPYNAATMRAERVNDHWQIDFSDVQTEDGTIRFRPVSSNQPKGKGFDDVLREAAIPIWIRWGSGLETELEPRRDQFPSAIIISQDNIVLVLTAPKLALNLNDLRENPNFTIRVKDEIKTLRLRSKDPAVTLDQTLDLNWKKDPGPDNDPDVYVKRTKPFVSGPHSLKIVFKTV